MPNQDWMSISLGLFEAVKKEFETSGQLSSDIMKSLHFVHGKTLLPAFDLIDSKKVKYILQLLNYFFVIYTYIESLLYCLFL